MVFIHLYHGRYHPDEEMDDWGSPGPTIGPVGMTYTYGYITLHGNDSCEDLITHDGLIYYNGVFYGDFEIQTYINTHITKTTSYEQFEKRSRLARQRMEDQLLSMPNVRPSVDDSGRGEGEDIPPN